MTLAARIVKPGDPVTILSAGACLLLLIAAIALGLSPTERPHD